MDTLREQQLEALQMAADYLDKLIPAMEQVASELKGEQKEDTFDFLNQIVEGLNFMLETYEVTSCVINEKELLVNDEALEGTVNELSSKFADEDCQGISDILGGPIVDFLKVFREAAKSNI